MRILLFIIFLQTLNLYSQDISSFTIINSTSTIFENLKKEKKEFSIEKTKFPLGTIVLTPTAYRGKGDNTIGTGLDINASYYIGRLYAKNTYSWTIEKKNYLDRIGLWLLEADGKMVIQTEGKYRPSMASGIKGTLAFRDSPQPTLNSPTASVKVDDKNTQTFASAYLSLSKHLNKKFILNIGYADGDMPKIIYKLSEFLSDSALKTQHGITNPKISKSTIYAGFIWIFKEKMPIEAEIIIPQNSVLNPKLINLQLGSLLKLNFQISYLTYSGGWEYLGMFNFKYSYFPK